MLCAEIFAENTNYFEIFAENTNYFDKSENRSKFVLKILVHSALFLQLIYLSFTQSLTHLISQLGSTPLGLLQQ